MPYRGNLTLTLGISTWRMLDTDQEQRHQTVKIIKNFDRVKPLKLWNLSRDALIYIHLVSL